MKVASCNLAASEKVEKEQSGVYVCSICGIVSPFCVIGRWIKRFFCVSLMRRMALFFSFFLHMAQLPGCALKCLITRAHTGINHLVRAAACSQWAGDWPHSEAFYAFFYSILIVFMRTCLFLLEGAYCCVTRCPAQRRSACPCPFIPFFFFMTKCQGKTSAQIHFVMLKPRGTHVLLLAHWARYLTPHRWMSACAASSWMQGLNSANRPPDGNKHSSLEVRRGSLVSRWKKKWRNNEPRWCLWQARSPLVASVRWKATWLNMASYVILLNKRASAPKLTFHFLS